MAPVLRPCPWLKKLIDRVRSARKPGAAYTRKSARKSRCSTSPRDLPVVCGQADDDGRRDPEEQIPRRFAQLRAAQSSPGAISVGDISATPFIIAQCIWQRSPTTRAIWTLPYAGASAGIRARSKSGRPRAGARSPHGSPRTFAAGKTMSAGRAACVGEPKPGRDGVHGRMGRIRPRRTLQFRVQRCRSIGASCFPTDCSARAAIR